MRFSLAWLILAAVWSMPADATPALQVLPEPEPQCVFGGRTQTINLRWHNSGNSADEIEIYRRIMQLTTATAVRIDEAGWKRLRVLSGQTVLETAALEFPPMRGRTRFLVQWLDSRGEILGSTDVLVYPTNLLAELGVLMNHAAGALGVFDPANELKPLLKNSEVEFVDLGNTALEDFRGKLAVIESFEFDAPKNRSLALKIKTLAANGIAVVWIQSLQTSLRPEDENPRPSFYSVPVGKSVVVIVQPGMVANLANAPRSQLNLIYFCKLALNPRPLAFPDFALTMGDGT